MQLHELADERQADAAAFVAASARILDAMKALQIAGVGDDGGLGWVPDNSPAGAAVELRADMDTLVVLSNTPHPLESGEQIRSAARRADDHGGAARGGR